VSRNLLAALAVLALLIALALGLLAWPRIAQADENVSFGIRPTKAYADIPESFSYFVHTLAPGASLADEALVINSGDVSVTLKLYAADAVTAINGGTSFANAGEEKNGVAHWLSPSLSEITLEPGEERAVPFTINVPPDASPGEHVAGLVVEAAPRQGASPSGEAPPTGENNAKFAVSVIRRAGVAVLIDVPGPRVAGLEITDVCFKEQDDQGATFEAAVLNTGNSFVRGQGSLAIKDRQGTELASIPIKMDAVLAGDATFFYVHHPVRLADGDYLLSAVLDYADGQTAVLDGVDLKMKEGQPEVGCQNGESETPEAGLAPPVTTLAPSDGEGGGQNAVYGAPVVAVLAVLALIIWHRLRRSRVRYPKS